MVKTINNEDGVVVWHYPSSLNVQRQERDHIDLVA